MRGRLGSHWERWRPRRQPLLLALGFLALFGFFEPRPTLAEKRFLQAPQGSPPPIERTNLGALTDLSDAIVVAEVTYVAKIDGRSWAVASVKETLRGTVPQQIHFLAEPLRTSDTYGTEAGETALLFLVVAAGRKGTLFARASAADLPKNSYLIAWSGRGKMPTRTIKGELYVDYWDNDVAFPISLSTVSGPDPKSDSIRSVKAADILYWIRDRAAFLP